MIIVTLNRDLSKRQLLSTMMYRPSDMYHDLMIKQFARMLLGYLMKILVYVFCNCQCQQKLTLDKLDR